MKKSIFFLTFLITIFINHSQAASKNTDDHKKSKPESTAKMMDDVLKHIVTPQVPLKN